MKSPWPPPRRRLTVISAVAAVVGIVVGGLVLPSAVGRAATTPAASGGTASTAPAFTATEALTRTFEDDPAAGQSTVVDQRNFSVTVSQTTQLRNRQEITVSWTGAHPTGGIVNDEQSPAAVDQEYPVVLMECRGVDSTTAPAAEQISPETCWTAFPTERSLEWTGSTGLWALDEYAPPPPTNEPGYFPYPNVNDPSPTPAGCGNYLSGYQYWLPFIGSDGTVYPTGPAGLSDLNGQSYLAGCGGAAPDAVPAANYDNTLIPPDTTFASTSLSGDGSTNFTVATSDTNGSLGCSNTVPCSLEIIPIEGLSCNPDAAPAGDTTDVSDCESMGAFTPGTINTSGSPPADSVSGLMWWSASNWRGRISVPLSFTAPASVCATENNSSPIDIYGSELMVQATQQWDPAFCLNPKLFNVEHVQTPEPEAKDLLKDDAVEAVYQGEPPVSSAGQSFFTTPTVQAPVAVTGFAIVFDIDTCPPGSQEFCASGQPYEQLRLDPRLLAKLLTESYPGDGRIAAGDPGVGDVPTEASGQNPYTIFDDPEFKALNPDYVQPSGVYSDGAATLFSIASQSDVIWALTSYINADPAARAWLNGQPDPWGMVVNPAYKGIQLPVESWPLLDTSTGGPNYQSTSSNQCLVTPDPLPINYTPIPQRPLVDNPQATLGEVALNMQFSIAASETSCQISADNIDDWTEEGRENNGNRFLIGLVPLASAVEYDLPTAELQTYVSPTAPTTFTDPADRVFVAPTNASLQAAAALLKPSASVGSWELPYTDFPSDPAAVSAYPGTMLMSLDVPTEGLTATAAKDLGEFLSFTAGTAQTPGFGNGQLPSGYLPMTAANGLGLEVDYTEAAAIDVTAQAGQVPVPGVLPTKPPPSTTTTTTTTTPTTTPSTTLPATSSTDVVQPPPSSVPVTSSPPSTSSASGVTKVKKSAAPIPIQQAVALGKTPGISSGIGSLAIPLAVLFALLGGIVITFSKWAKRGTGALRKAFRRKTPTGS